MGWTVVIAILSLVALLCLLPTLRGLGERLRRERMEAEVRRLRELERRLGVAAPEVRALRARVWRYLLGHPDPVEWGRYRWKAG